MQSLKLLAALLVCTVFIFGLSKVGVLVTNQWLPHTNSFSESTLIANEEVSNTSKQAALEKIEDAKNQWLINGTIYLEWAGQLQPLPKEAFAYNILESVEYAEDGSQNPLKVELAHGTLLEQIEEITQNSDVFASMDTDKLKSDLETVASLLKEGDHTFSFSDYLVEGNTIAETDIQKRINLLGGTAGAELNVLNGKEIQLNPQHTFSLDMWLADEEITLADESASILASLFYEVIAPTNFTIVERHISKELPSWATEGYEARFQKDKMDFVFTNPNNGRFTIQLSVDSTSMTANLNGGELPYTYEVKQVEKKALLPKKVIQYSATLATNQTRVKETGRNGSYIQLVRTALDSSGKAVETSVYSEDYYAPIQRVELHSLTKPVVATDTNNDGTNTGANNNPNTNPGTNTGTNNGTNNNNTGTNNNNTGNNNNTNTGTNTGNNSGNTNNNSNSGNSTGNPNTNTGNNNTSNPGTSNGDDKKEDNDSGKGSGAEGK
ncbi:VanW family protein [Sutcliffiella rhizosphaerae]|uniref:G5 domain-containing protein n=1 Tax=Sutcliffiella rhizosphaerae TaxID=2880967 RepID=A0ABM8YI92_9BACI|nr:VanW family protein [Sutcliffiella rhizosphaerae]CAG9619513.1 hypothetical protein BACCIP111883_00280 [Sutcliffiella rhizosphaerae]